MYSSDTILKDIMINTMIVLAMASIYVITTSLSTMKTHLSYTHASPYAMVAYLTTLTISNLSLNVSLFLMMVWKYPTPSSFVL